MWFRIPDGVRGTAGSTPKIAQKAIIPWGFEVASADINIVIL